jgi:hypothetical protein
VAAALFDHPIGDGSLRGGHRPILAERLSLCKWLSCWTF